MLTKVELIELSAKKRELCARLIGLYRKKNTGINVHEEIRVIHKYIDLVQDQIDTHNNKVWFNSQKEIK